MMSLLNLSDTYKYTKILHDIFYFFSGRSGQRHADPRLRLSVYSKPQSDVVANVLAPAALQQDAEAERRAPLRV